ncbi:3-phosphoshikimate 1-carboxyvinyltransferase [Candidatus Peregrinibacteria bacterium]|nr:3-phosphoshikimate 1-carboxyvinyltransferase [Candidatus Peregrinibacteria bacterium]
MNAREVIPLKQRPDFSLTLPGSKSITNRAFLCAVLAKGKSRIYGALESEDTTAMLNALRKFEVRISKSENYIEIEGNGGKFKPGNVTVNAGASGTTTRFLTALSVLREGKTAIKGTKRMKERPIKDLEDALGQLNRGERLIRIKGDKSSQFLSALLMISPLFSPLKIEVTGKLVSKPYIDITIAVMKAFGVSVQNKAYKTFIVKPQQYKAADYWTEGDASAASYWTAMAYLHKGKVKFENLKIKNSIQGDAHFEENLKKLGKISVIDMNAMPDAAMTAAVMAPFARRRTKITGLSTLRIKETDRLAALEKELKKIGVNVSTTKDSITIRPAIHPTIRPTIRTYNDHRMAMCFAVLGTKTPGIVIEDPTCVDKTYPEFWEDLERAYLTPVKLGGKNLVLTGMRCSGKTRHGRKIATLLGRPFVDLDMEIERLEGKTIPEIVKKYGWDTFRKMESLVCRAITKYVKEPLVIATGGGVVLDEKNIKNLKKNGINVFIFADPYVIAERVKKKAGTRPSLTGKKPDKEVYEVWKARRDLYLKYADIVWDNTGGKILGENLKNIF